MNNEKPCYYSILTADVRYCKSLSSSEKLLYSEITALCNQNGFCNAFNAYFSKLYSVDVRTIQRWLSNLEKLGFIRIESDIDNGNNRKIYLVLASNTHDKNVILPHDKNVIPPYDKNVIHNNTSINNTSINIKNNSLWADNFRKKYDNE